MREELNMRKIDYLSPSAIQKFKDSKDEFYLKYLCFDRVQDEPQSLPMAAGSSFDAYVKNYLFERLFGKGYDPKFDLQSLFDAQVQSHNRDTAYEVGKYCFDEYKQTGALTDLLLDLQQSVNVPRFEVEIKGVVSGYREGMIKESYGITFLGKPDLFYINKAGMFVILDWKVSGYYSKYNTSPLAGYVRLRGDGKKSGHHRDCILLMHGGTLINGGTYLEQLNEQWATQLSIYAWLGGSEIGDDFIAAIDQICCSPSGTNKPLIRVAEHRLRITPKFQHSVFATAQHIWTLCHSDHFFEELTKEESQARCALLDTEAKALRGDGSQKDQDFLRITRER